MANDLAPSRLKSQATFTDLNRDFGQSGAADILLDKDAIKQSLYNIFRTSIGEAGPIFMPTLGSMLPKLLQEPLDNQTAFDIKSAAIQSVQRQETRVDIDVGQTSVVTDNTLPGYIVTLVYTIRETGEKTSSTIPLNQRGASGETEPPPQGSAPAWYPTDVRSLTAWFDAADTRSIVQSISSFNKWKDKSGRGNTASVLSADLDSFVLKSGGINGLSALQLATGTSPNSLLLTEPITLKNNFHLFVVAKNNYRSYDSSMMVGFNVFPQDSLDPYVATLKVAYGHYPTIPAPYVLSKRVGGGQIIAPYQDTLNDLNESFLEIRYANGLLEFFINGLLVKSSATSSYSGVVTNTLIKCFGDVPELDQPIMLGEIILMTDNTLLPTADVDQVRSYLNSKWTSSALAPAENPI